MSRLRLLLESQTPFLVIRYTVTSLIDGDSRAVFELLTKDTPQARALGCAPEGRCSFLRGMAWARLTRREIGELYTHLRHYASHYKDENGETWDFNNFKQCYTKKATHK